MERVPVAVWRRQCFLSQSLGNSKTVGLHWTIYKTFVTNRIMVASSSFGSSADQVVAFGSLGLLASQIWLPNLFSWPSLAHKTLSRCCKSISTYRIPRCLGFTSKHRSSITLTNVHLSRTSVSRIVPSGSFFFELMFLLFHISINR